MHRVLPYDGKSLPTAAFANFNPFDSGEWAEPEYVSENLYSIRGAVGTLYYNPEKTHRKNGNVRFGKVRPD